MKTAEEMKIESDLREQKRLAHWKDFDEVVHDDVIKKNEELMKNSTAIYWREVNLHFDIGKAEKKYLEDKGFIVYRPSNVNGGPNFIIAW